MQPITTKQYELYLQRYNLSAQISDLEKRVAIAKKERAAIDNQLLGHSTLANGGERKLPNGHILIVKKITVSDSVVTPDMKVGDVIRKGYTSYRFKESEPVHA